MFTGTHLVDSYIKWWIPKTLGPSTKMITWMIWGAPICKGIWKRDLLHPFHTEKQMGVSNRQFTSSLTIVDLFFCSDGGTLIQENIAQQYTACFY
jgi:hypothetical protein